MILNPFFQNDIAYSSNTFIAVPKATLLLEDEEDSDFEPIEGDSGVSDSSSCSSMQEVSAISVSESRKQQKEAS